VNFKKFVHVCVVRLYRRRTCHFFYTLLISTKLHIIHMLIHIGNEMEPFRRHDDKAFLVDIIGTGAHQYEEDAAEDDGSQYLNDTGDGDDNQPEDGSVQRYI